MNRFPVYTTPLTIMPRFQQRIAFALLALMTTFAACDGVSTPDTPTNAGGTPPVAIRVDLPPDAAAPTDPTTAARGAAPPLYLQPRDQNLAYGCVRDPGDPENSSCRDLAVDFTVPEGTYWILDEISIEAFFFEDPTSVFGTSFEGFSFDLYADEGGQPAPAPFFSRTDAAFTSEVSSYFFDVSGATAPVLAPGTYWLAFDMVNEADGFRPSFYWGAKAPAVGSPALVQGEVEGEWVSFGDDQDLGFSLFGFSTGIDIRPGSDENPVNLRSRGLLPVAVLSTDAFDATTLDPAAITLGDNDGADTPVATRRNGTLFASLEDVNEDGLLDLVLHFEVQALVANGDLDAGTTFLVLNGATSDGGPLRAADAVRIVPGV